MLAALAVRSDRDDGGVSLLSCAQLCQEEVMWARVHSFRLYVLCLCALVMALPFGGSPSFAQEEAVTGAVVEKSARERGRRER